MGPGSCSCGRCRFRFPLSKVGVGPRHAWRLVDKRVRWRGRNKTQKLLKRFERPGSLELPHTWPFYLLQVEPHGGSGKLDMSNCHCAWCRRAHSVPWWKIWSWWWRSLSTSTQWLFLNLATDWKSCFGAATQVLNHILASILIFTQLFHVFSLQNGECSWIVGRIINVWQVWCRYTFSSWYFFNHGNVHLYCTKAAFASYVTARSRDVLQKVCLDDARMLGLKLEMWVTVRCWPHLSSVWKVRKWWSQEPTDVIISTRMWWGVRACFFFLRRYICGRKSGQKNQWMSMNEQYKLKRLIL